MNNVYKTGKKICWLICVHVFKPIVNNRFVYAFGSGEHFVQIFQQLNFFKSSIIYLLGFVYKTNTLCIYIEPVLIKRFCL